MVAATVAAVAAAVVALALVGIITTHSSIITEATHIVIGISGNYENQLHQ